MYTMPDSHRVSIRYRVYLTILMFPYCLKALSHKSCCEAICSSTREISNVRQVDVKYPRPVIFVDVVLFVLCCVRVLLFCRVVLVLCVFSLGGWSVPQTTSMKPFGANRDCYQCDNFC